VNAQYKWLKFYVAAVLETNSEVLSERIEAAQNAIGQRVITLALDDAERLAMIKTLNALTPSEARATASGVICCQCLDAHDLVTPANGKTYLAKTGMGEIVVTLHMRCAIAWADRNGFQTLVSLRRARAAGPR
jgi:hypothetical protein